MDPQLKLLRWLLLPAYLSLAMTALAWGTSGHQAIGVLAVERAGHPTREQLRQLLGTLDAEFIAETCNWPDSYKATAAGFWSEPLHWVNVDPDDESYLPRRDCPERQCLPAAVTQYAARLGDNSLTVEERQLAFAFLCHYTADLHQPLHVGYEDDQGGNLVTVRHRGEETNLHSFWDTRLAATHVNDWQELLERLRGRVDHPDPPPWRPTDIVDWTNESYTFTRYFAYPPEPQISPEFETEAWNVALNQMDMAASRLAAILDAVLK